MKLPNDRFPVHWDPFSRASHEDLHAVWKRMRDEAPLYRNEEYDFWALSRFQDVFDVRVDWRTYTSTRGTQIEMIRAGEINSYVSSLLVEDPPIHTVHRHLLNRSFTPRAIKQIEDRVRTFVRRKLDELVGSDGFDYVDDFGVHVPAMVIASMLGTPDSDVDTIRHLLGAMLHSDEGQDLDRTSFNKGSNAIGEYFMEHVRARRNNPTDDLMSALVTIEFTDDQGVIRKLTDLEACRYIHLLSGAGNETVARFSGWMVSSLAKFPAERAKLVDRPELIPNAIEEILRYDPPVKASARVSLRDVEWYGELVPAGSAIVVVTASTGRDEREFTNPDVLDVERRIERHLAFGFGIHVCLGASLARLESRIMLEETLARFPEWDVDWSGTEMVHLGSAIRGYKHLPITFS